MYATLIAEILETQYLTRLIGGTMFTPRRVEAYMRLEHATLDALTRDQFIDKVVASCECILVGGAAAADALADSFGLRAA